MRRTFVGFALCLVVGAGVALSGLGGVLSLDGFAPPPVPDRWAALPGAGRVDVAIVSSEAFVRALGDGLSSSQVAMRREGGLALVDGRVFAVSSASVRQLLRKLAWDGLPIEARQATIEELDRFAAPEPVSLAWRARSHAYIGLRSSRDLVAAHPSFTAASLASAFLLLACAFVRSFQGRSRDEGVQVQPSAWRRELAAASRPPAETQPPVHCVVVPDAATLAHVRTAIGEEHVIAATEHAFAFADGWILAVRKGSVFELVSELGWRKRPLEMSTRADLVGEGHAVSAVPSDDRGDTLDLLEALHVCGPLAHRRVPGLSSSALSFG